MEMKLLKEVDDVTVCGIVNARSKDVAILQHKNGSITGRILFWDGGSSPLPSIQGTKENIQDILYHWINKKVYISFVERFLEMLNWGVKTVDDIPETSKYDEFLLIYFDNGYHFLSTPITAYVMDRKTAEKYRQEKGEDNAWIIPAYIPE
jgi:hypothetical protein